MSFAAGLDQNRLKAMAIALWREGGMNTLVKVMPHGLAPSPGRNVGYCTTFKYVAGRTPGEMEQAVGFRIGSKLAFGADIYAVHPLPGAGQFRLAGYSQTPEGIPTGIKPAHVDYPPGLGVPQWELTAYPQSNLRLLGSVSPGQRFSFTLAQLERAIATLP